MVLLLQNPLPCRALWFVFLNLPFLTGGQGQSPAVVMLFSLNISQGPPPGPGRSFMSIRVNCQSLERSYFPSTAFTLPCLYGEFGQITATGRKVKCQQPGGARVSPSYSSLPCSSHQPWSSPQHHSTSRKSQSNEELQTLCHYQTKLGLPCKDYLSGRFVS